ncbi:tetratricopeptide repeat protein [Telmatobacter sp. DSM 110680]|uniref:Tetratricopeptide repeat protein n=1 Tax=Telmatobacter sp. DSM 110680 TaxID=3036704 RepID=A0AAU7DK17_9BACT
MSRPSQAQSRSSAATHSTTETKTFESLSKSADEARDAGRLDDAVKLYRRALTLNPKWTEGWWSLGTLHYDSDRYLEAQLAFGKVVALDPKQGTARAMLGLCEFELGKSEQALKDIEASKSLGVLEDKQLRDVVVYHDGILLQRAGQFEAAKAALTSLCLNGVRSSELAGTFGMVALRMRDVAAPDPSTEAGEVVQHAGRGACLNAAKEYETAKTEFDQVIARAPHFPLVHYAYGCALVDARDIPGAIKEFEAEIAEQPKSVLPRLHIAVAEYKVDSAAGLKYAEEAVQLDPKLPLGHYLLGLLLLDTGAYERAVPELETARKAFPQEGRIDLSLATAYAHVGRLQDAAQARVEFARKKQAEQAKAEGAVEITDAMNARTKQ